MSWWKRKPRELQAGSVLFRGKWPARPEDFAFLEKRGISLRLQEQAAGQGWSASLEHRDWGQANLIWQPEMPPPPRVLIDWDPRLTAEEKALAHQAGSTLPVTAEPRSGNVLADRKDLLRFLRAVMGEDGLGAMDHIAQAFWSREGLDEELAHDAELDIDAIYTLHLLGGHEEETSEDRRAFWVHSHGLQEIGFQDFDLLNPTPELHGHAQDLLRALAFATVEGRLVPGGQPFPLASGVGVSGVEARAFLAASGEAYPEWRDSLDEAHLDGHLVVCEPVSRGLWARLTGRHHPRPCRFLQGTLPEEMLIFYSPAATDLMSRRARQMLPTLRALQEELAELELPTLVKLGYATDDQDGTEHLWFQVHAFQGDQVDATLINQPFHIQRMTEGQRSLHPLELLSDWMIVTPLGRIDPRSTRVVRALRVHREGLVAALKEMRVAEG